MGKNIFNFQKTVNSISDNVFCKQINNGIIDAYGDSKDAYVDGICEGLFEGTHQMYDRILSSLYAILKDNGEISLSDALKLLFKK